jgi:hypothetical protein
MEEIDVIENVKNGPYTKVNMRNYINNYFKKKNIKEICTRMTITIYNELTYRRFVISAYNLKDIQIAKINFYSSTDVFTIYYLYDDLKWRKSKIRNQDIIEDLHNLKTYMVF